MATLFDRLSVSLEGGGFASSLVTQAAQFAGIAAQAARLAAEPPGAGDFSARLSGLSAPRFAGGASMLQGFGGARAAVSGVSANGAPDVGVELGRFAETVATRLLPLVASTVAVARGIQDLAGAQFHCPPAPAGGAAPAAPPPPAPAPSTAGPERLAVARERAAMVSSLLQTLPDPLTPAALLELLVALAGGKARTHPIPIVIPIFDDLVQPLRTLASWSLATPAELGDRLAATLTLLRDRLTLASEGRLDAALAPALALRAQLRPDDLDAFGGAYVAAAAALADAPAAGDGSEAAARAAELDAAIAAFEPVRTAMAAPFSAPAPAAAARLGAAPAAVLDSLLHLAVQLEPVDPSRFLPPHRTAPVDAGAEAELRDLLAPITDFLEDLAEKLDLSGVEAGIADVAGECREIAEAVERALVSVAQQTRAAFAEVEAAVRDLPLDALADDIRAGIAEAGEAIRSSVRAAFAPFREAVEEAVQAVADAVDGLDPAEVAAALAAAVDEIAGVLDDPQVQAAVDEIRGVLTDAAEAAAGLSFAPVTDEVIALIEQMTDGLRALGSAELNDAVKGLLSTALAVLPPDLRPVTQPLVLDFGVAIEQGPVPLLEAVRAKPQELMDLIRGFDPGAVAGEALGPPFREAMAALEQFRPSALIAPLDQVLEREKTRLTAQASPSQALAPLSKAFDDLLAELDRLSPDALLRPIEAQVEQAIRDVVEASPVDEIFAGIEGVFDTVEALLDTVRTVGAALAGAAAALGGFGDPDAALDAWRDAVLDKIETVPNRAAVDALLAGIVEAVESARLPDLLARYDAAVAPLAADLAPVAAEARLAEMVRLRQRLGPLVRALPAGPARSEIEQALARFDPLDPLHSAPLRGAADLARAVREARAALDALAPDFGRLLHGPAGPLSELAAAAADAGLLRAEVARETDAALGPVRFAFRKLAGAAPPVRATAASLADLDQRVTARLGNIVSGPGSLRSIAESVQAVVDALRNIDFAFLRESIEGVFRAVRGELEAAGPTPIVIALDREFRETIDGISLALLLPPAEVAALDEAAAALVAKLRALDPERLVGDAVGPAFEAKVLPLVEKLDITPVFDALIEALRGLESELEAELGRVNTAYQALLAARPAGVGAGASLGLG